jgi:phosphoribosyl 1,2-cyclic phosphodiesterase
VSLKISVLGSGSSGNCTFISSSKTKILLDAGFNRSQTIRRLNAIGESLEGIEALVISHEHSDHVSGLPSLLAKHDIPVFTAEGTSEALTSKFSLKKIEFIKAGQPFMLGDLKISPFTIPHDAVDPMAFILEAEGVRVAHVTDLGYMTELVVQRLRECDIIILESNHDLEMLRIGPYPWFLKQRILSREGHLSNEMAGKFFSEHFDGRARFIVLAHLSENNNHPDIARMVATEALEGRAFNLENLLLASRTVPSRVIEV